MNLFVILLVLTLASFVLAAPPPPPPRAPPSGPVTHPAPPLYGRRKASENPAAGPAHQAPPRGSPRRKASENPAAGPVHLPPLGRRKATVIGAPQGPVHQAPAAPAGGHGGGRRNLAPCDAVTRPCTGLGQVCYNGTCVARTGGQGDRPDSLGAPTPDRRKL